MKKKIIIVVALLLAVVLLGLGYNAFLAPRGVEGEKEVSIHILIENEEIDEVFNFKTDHEFLYDLLKENEEKLGLSFQAFDFGTMIVGMMGHIADEASEYFHIYINNEDSMSGIKEIPLHDNDNYKFELVSWK